MTEDKLARVMLIQYLTDRIPRSKTASYLTKIKLKMDHFSTNYEPVQTEFATGDKLTRDKLSQYLTEQVQRCKTASYLTM